MNPTILPNDTLYIQRLNEKVKKPELKESLYSLFSPFGRILDIVALKTIKCRGQAFVVFEDTSCSTAALRSLQGFNFYDQPIKISYAKSTSNATLIKEGKFFPLLKKAKTETTKPVENAAETKKRARNDSDIEEDDSDMEEDDDDSGEPATKSVKVDEQSDESLPPNAILFLRNLPSDINEEMITFLFAQYPGFKETRMVPGTNGIAFVEFLTVAQATIAKSVLNGFNVTPKKRMVVEY
ncbi:hypothetical protein HK099_002469, partial [Clydaea vesicula]